MEHDEHADHLEREADRMDQQSDEVGDRIEDVRHDWDSKQHDTKVPGAQPDPGEEEESVAGAETDVDELSEQGGP